MLFDISKLNTSPGVTGPDLSSFEESWGRRLPEAYQEFLRTTNGAHGSVGATHVILWALQELLPLNAEYAVDEFAPGLLLFGSDGGGRAFGFDTRDPRMPIVEVPFIGMDLDQVAVVAPTFDSFLRALAAEED